MKDKLTDNNGNISPNRYYSPECFAKRYGVSTRTIIRLIDNGEIPALRIGRQWKIKGLDIIAFEEANYHNILDRS